MNGCKKTLWSGALTLILAGGCSQFITSGQIIEKRHEPQREYVKNGAHRIGRVWVPYKQRMIDDEDFIITFGKKGDEESGTRTIYVNKKIYDSLNVGDTFDTSKFPYESSDPNRKKIRHYH